MTMANYLVTGAAGFIGGAVAKRLIDEGHLVTTIDNLSTGREENIPEGIEFIYGNCQDENLLSKLSTKKFDTIFHIAGQSSGEISFDDPIYDLQTNAQSTLVLLNLSKRINCKRFIYASTMSVYGDQPDEPVTENHSTIPKSFYAVGKLASENYLSIYNKNFGIQTTSLRLFNVYGPGQNMDNLKQGMVSIFLAQALENRNIIVKGSPDRFRDQVYIDDVTTAFILANWRSTTSHLDVNICTGIKTYVKDVLYNIQRMVPFETSIQYQGSTPGDQFGIYGDPSKAENVLSWKAKISFDVGIKKMINWATNK